jgi:hypothetical protein
VHARAKYLRKLFRLILGAEQTFYTRMGTQDLTGKIIHLIEKLNGYARNYNYGSVKKQNESINFK